MVRDLTVEEKALLADIQAEPDLESYFFKKLKGLHWLLPLHEKGYFTIDNLPEPEPSRQEGYIQVPYWPASIYLANISSELGREENLESAKVVLDIVRGITKEAKDRDISNYKVWYQFAQVINNISVSLISEQDISIIEYWMDDPYERGLAAEEVGTKLLKNLIITPEKRDISIMLIKVIFAISYNDKKTGAYERKEGLFRIKHYTIDEIIKVISPLIVDNLQVAGLELFEFILTEFLDNTDGDKWSSLWRSAIEKHEQNRSNHDSENLIIDIFRDSLHQFTKNDPEKAVEYIKHLLETKYITLKRVAIYIIGEHIEELSMLVSIIIDNDYFADVYRHESWQFMHKNYVNLPSSHQKIFLEFIDGITLKDDKGNIDESATAYKKAVWHSSIKNSSNDLNTEYNSLIKLAGAEPEHPDFTSYMGSIRDIDYKSPIPFQELQKMEVDVLIQTMDVADEGDGFHENGRTGIIKTFRSVVKSKPEDILKNIHLFVDKDLAYSYQIIEGFRELWNEKETLRWNIAWQMLLDFSQSLISYNEFWSVKYSEQRNAFIANRHWLVSSVSELIEDGVRSDEHAFDLKLLPQAFEILQLLLEKQEGVEFDISGESVTTAINSSRGKCIEALINHALRSMRQCELIGKTKGEIWGQYVDIFNKEIKKQDVGEFEFVTLVANYLPNFLYMSNDWVLDNLSNIFNKNNHQAWVSAFNGYSYVGTVYQVIYTFLRDNNHFAMALDDENLRSQVSDKIIQGAVVAFLNDFESLEDEKSLLSLVISRRHYNEIHQIIWFSWTLRKKDDNKLNSKILELWPKIQEIIDFKSDYGKKIASDLCDWVVFVDDIKDDTFQLLDQIAPFAEYNHNSHELLKGINRLSMSKPREAQKLWLHMLEEYSYAYPEDEIKGTLSNFLKLDKDSPSHEGRRLAHQIIDAYLRQGQDRPREWLDGLLK